MASLLCVGYRLDELLLKGCPQDLPQDGQRRWAAPLGRVPYTSGSEWRLPLLSLLLVGKHSYIAETSSEYRHERPLP